MIIREELYVTFSLDLTYSTSISFRVLGCMKRIKKVEVKYVRSCDNVAYTSSQNITHYNI